ncbi:hypothetical protein [Streptomyces sp. NPDC060194]|uniref:hypothetical protein n=1 Tax=Streptomyces sp. NPDC060194 TaxID=3347069 RepID=UPI00366929AF
MGSTRRAVGPVRALGTLCLVAALTACQFVSGSETNRSGPEADPTADGTVSPTLSPQGYGVRFLALSECSSRERSGFNEVSCTSERAAAQVIARHDGPREKGPLCPGPTDFVLHISESAPASRATEEDPGVPRGYACMRNLEAPHPGDPGGGGGPRTIVGDCVQDTREGEVRETACDGTGDDEPGYRVRSAVTERSSCPDSTDLYVQLGGKKPVGCAERV